MTHGDLTGRLLGEFVLGERLGEGGHGTVYRARQPALGRDVVVKVLRAQRRHSPIAQERFLREAQLASLRLVAGCGDGVLSSMTSRPVYRLRSTPAPI